MKRYAPSDRMDVAPCATMSSTEARQDLDLFGRCCWTTRLHHRVVWSHAAALGIRGTVVRIDGAVRDIPSVLADE